jgi:hypothetical protein
LKRIQTPCGLDGTAAAKFMLRWYLRRASDAKVQSVGRQSSPQPPSIAIPDGVHAHGIDASLCSKLLDRDDSGRVMSTRMAPRHVELGAAAVVEYFSPAPRLIV